MNTCRKRQTGFALILVLLLIVSVSILGVSYATSATIKLASSQNLLKAGEAQYLAESGLQHALYVLQSDPLSLDGSIAAPLGPYTADSTGDSYYFYVVPDGTVTGKYYVTAEASVGGVVRTASYTVLANRTRQFSLDHAMVLGAGVTFLPATVSLQGDIYHNGDSLTSYASIDGDVTSQGSVSDPTGGITGTITTEAPTIDMPPVTVDYYKNYRFEGVTCAAVEVVDSALQYGDPVTNGGSISETNPGGVAWLKPAVGDTIQVKMDVDFTGTIIVEGNLRIEGKNVRLTALEGFPAIIVTGRIEINSQAEAIIDGTVVASGGIFAGAGSGTDSLLTINGALITDSVGFDPDIKGQHQVNHDPSKSRLYDFSSEDSTDLLIILSYD